MTNAISKSEMRTLITIYGIWQETGEPASVNEIMKTLGLKSTHQVRKNIIALLEANYICGIPNDLRGFFYMVNKRGQKLLQSLGAGQ